MPKNGTGMQAVWYSADVGELWEDQEGSPGVLPGGFPHELTLS